MHPAIPSKGGIFEGFAVELDNEEGSSTAEDFAAHLEPEWSLQPFGERGTDFEVTLKKGKLSTREAWNHAYELREYTGVNYAEPMFATSISDNPAWLKDPASVANETHLQESRNPEWSLEAIRAKEAWKKFFPNPSRLPGHAISVGHPDTGYQDHPELEGRVLAAKGYDFLYDDPDAHDDLERPLSEPIPNPGHGTGTASVIVSPVGAQRFAGRGWVTGVAPGAHIIPLRTAYSVMLLSTSNLARAIEYATKNGAHVISISMGGLFSWRLREAVAFAKSNGVIICAAAGNYAPFVGWPGAYEEVISCAASNAVGGTWKWGCRGRAVDVTAPGESVWRATVRKEGKNFVYDVGRGNGTSLATTTTAGVAVMWLSYHGRDELISRYGIENLVDIFQRVLCDSCMKFPGWKEGKFGAGLIDACAVLDAELPEAWSQRESPVKMTMQFGTGIHTVGFATFHHLFDSAAERDLVFALCALLRVAETDVDRTLNEVGHELAFHLATDPQAYRTFRRIADPSIAPDAPVIDALRTELASRASSRLRTQLSDKKRASGKQPLARTRFSQP